MRGSICISMLALFVSSTVLRAGGDAAGLQIAVLEGGGAKNSTLADEARPITVEVRDSAGKAVSDATVTALLPAQGPGAAFSWGSEVATRQTDGQGRATFSGMRLRKLPGDFEVRLIATANGQRSSLSVMQSVRTDEPAPAPRRWSRRRYAILGIAGAGIAAGLTIALVHTDSSTPSQAAAGVFPGNPTVTGPR